MRMAVERQSRELVSSAASRPIQAGEPADSMKVADLEGSSSKPRIDFATRQGVIPSAAQGLNPTWAGSTGARTTRSPSVAVVPRGLAGRWALQDVDGRSVPRNRRQSTTAWVGFVLSASARHDGLPCISSLPCSHRRNHLERIIVLRVTNNVRKLVTRIPIYGTGYVEKGDQGETGGDGGDACGAQLVKEGGFPRLRGAPGSLPSPLAP